MRPNILYINCDDLGYGDLGCYGSACNRTPTIDSLAREGMRFTDFYAASPLCTPSRGALMTGCYPQRIGFSVFDGKVVLMPGQGIGLSHGETALPQILKSAGYETMIIGKWHCGDQPEFLPTRYGFDHFYGLPYSNDMGRQSRTWGVPLEELDKRYPPLPLLLDDEILEQQPDQRGLIERYTEQAVRFFRRHEGPFFLYFAPLQVHLPLYAPERFVRESQNGDFGACVECVDWALSVMVYELKRLGMYEDTLIVFTSDNGSRGDHGASNGRLRGSKGTTWEGGQRVPFLARWEGHIPAGRVCSALSSNLDILPTFAALTGIPLGGKPIDGVDLSPILFEGGTQEVRGDFYYYYTDCLEAVRSGGWKLHFRKEGKAMRALYNLRSDPGETDDRLAAFPEIVEKLEAVADACRACLGDAATGSVGSGTRAPGRVEHPRMLTEYAPDHPYIIALYDKEEDG